MVFFIMIVHNSLVGKSIHEKYKKSLRKVYMSTRFSGSSPDMLNRISKVKIRHLFKNW